MARLVWLIFFVFPIFLLEARVIETRHVEDILPYIDKDTWLLVDLDNTMFEGREALGHACWFGDELEQRLKQGMSRDEAIADIYPLWIETQKVNSVKPLEKNFIPTLKSLQREGITIMGLTHRQPSVVDSTVRQVHSLDFDFTTSAPFQGTLIVPARTPTEYYHGILFVGEYNRKIDVFEPFLKMIHKTPKKVVFIDNRRKNVDELESLSQQGIEYLGVHYTAINFAPCVYNPDVAAFQYKYLHQILSNADALLLMKNQGQ